MTDQAARKRGRLQPLLIRFAHWANVPLLIFMAGSGLQIFKAYPALGPRGELYEWYPFQEVPPPAWVRFGGWLGSARHWHFALAWLLVGNAVIYLLYVCTRGEWRRRAFLPQRDTWNALRMIGYYLRLRAEPPAVDFYNGLQRLAYSSAIGLGLVEVLSGLAIYKPVQLHWLAALFGGYDGARAVHLMGLVLLVLFTAAHLVMVALHPRAILDMLTGGRRG
ncbi:MAG: cytochrome b/b6 domain-containing protein [Deltaproteobacteria bacterium]|nr:cytochrome b/b6 domain-containing protein [Deltaproteobacteria bacterium]MBI3388155.1 cytochrome b/b6 domain-containing protein [Deltaproteobacteria bacterium]